MGHAADRECRAVGRARSSSAAPRATRRRGCSSPVIRRARRATSVHSPLRAPEEINAACQWKAPANGQTSGTRRRAHGSHANVNVVVAFFTGGGGGRSGPIPNAMIAQFRGRPCAPLFPIDIPETGIAHVNPLALPHIFETYGTLGVGERNVPSTFSQGRLEHTTRGAVTFARADVASTFATFGTRTRETVSREGLFTGLTHGRDSRSSRENFRAERSRST